MACSIRRRWFPCLRASPNAGFGTMYAAEYTRSPRLIAREKGLDVNERGRIPAGIVAQFEAANGR
jgi:hypothetical protein